MKKILNIIISLLLLFVLFGLDVFASDNAYSTSSGEFVKVGSAGAQFLKIPLGARGNSMAGAYTSVTNDLTSIFWNPAGLADIKSMSGNFSSTQWFANYNQNFAAVSLPVGPNFSAAVSFLSFGCDKIEITTIEKPQGTGTYYSVNDMAFGLSFAGYLTDQFSFGVTTRYIQNNFADLYSNGFSFDVGTLYETGIQGIKLGFSIHNLGTEMQYSGQDLNRTIKLVDELNAAPLDAQYLTNGYNMPLTFRAGISSELYNEGEHKLLAAADFITLSDTKEQFCLGAEYTWNEILSARLGYKFGQDQFGFAGGFGVSYLGGGVGGQIDYSITPTKDIGYINRITLNLLMQ